MSRAKSTKTRNVTERLRALRDTLARDLVQRDDAVRLALLAALAGEHLLLIGPPGTAKSLIARRLRLAFQDADYFERLLTRFTVPEELFGPLSIKGLERDEYHRLTKGYLPTASVAFLDEIFKANSAILNALLTLLNERAFDNGVERVDAPLVAVIGASNELPEGEELDALYDRFLLRLHVGPVSKDGFRDLLRLRGGRDPGVEAALKLTAADLAAVREQAETVAVPEVVETLLVDLRTWCMAQELPVSDRRWRKVVKLLQVSAWTNGRGAVSIWDAWLLQHCLWQTPEQREAIYDWYTERVGVQQAMDPTRLTKLVTGWEARLEHDRGGRQQRRDKKGRLLYKGLKGRPITKTKETRFVQRKGESVFLAPDVVDSDDRSNSGKGFTVNELKELHYRRNGYRRRLINWDGLQTYLADDNNRLREEVDLPPLMEPKRFAESYAASSLDQTDKQLNEVDVYLTRLTEHRATMKADVSAHLWVDSAFITPAAATLDQTQHHVEALRRRLKVVRDGVAQLPRDLVVEIAQP